MSNTTFSLNTKAIEDATDFALIQVASMLINEIAKVAPRDLTRLPETIYDRKDGKKPIRKHLRRPLKNINGHWYEGVTGNLKHSIGHELDLKNKRVIVGTDTGGPAAEYAGYAEGMDKNGDFPSIEFGTPRKSARPYLRPTIADPKVKEMLLHEFKRAFFEYSK